MSELQCVARLKIHEGKLDELKRRRLVALGRSASPSWRPIGSC